MEALSMQEMPNPTNWKDVSAADASGLREAHSMQGVGNSTSWDRSRITDANESIETTTSVRIQAISESPTDSSPGEDSREMGTLVVQNKEQLQLTNWKDANPATVQKFLAEVAPFKIAAGDIIKLRLLGNERFKENDYGAALEAYTRIINFCKPMAVRGMSEPIRRFANETLKLVLSNRAQVNLQMRMWESSLFDAKLAVKLDPYHVKSLYRKGCAYLQLQHFQKAIKAFETALKFGPRDRHITAALKEGKKLLRQSITGEYDLTEHLLHNAPPPSCSDFVGPVEIKYTPSSGRGLFLTQDVKPGQLLMAANALAFGGQRKDDQSGYMYNLADELVYVSNSSKRHLHQIHYLRGKGVEDPSITEDVPSLELYIPGNSWTPDRDLPPLELMDAYQKAALNSFDAVRSVIRVPFGDGLQDEIENEDEFQVCGVWALPSFLNHSCIPNTTCMTVGKTMFVRAAENLSAGIEVTLSYSVSCILDNSSRLANWNFECKCERCLINAAVRAVPELAALYAKYNEYLDVSQTLQNELRQDTNTYLGHTGPLRELDKLIERIEELIQSMPMELDERQKNWIRFAFNVSYAVRMHIAARVGNKQLKIDCLKKLFAMYSGVNMGSQSNLTQTAATLLDDVEEMYGAGSAEYLEVKEGAIYEFRKGLGMELTEDFIMELLRVRFHKKNQWFGCSNLDRSGGTQT